jgi:hypothetical protein
MKSVSIILTREDVKRNMRFYEIWILIFVLLLITSTFTRNAVSNFIFSIMPLFVASIGFFINKRYLKEKGKVISRTVTDMINIKNSLLVDKIMIVFYLVLMGLLVVIGMIEKSDDIIGVSFFFVFILSVFYKRVKAMSYYTKNR